MSFKGENMLNYEEMLSVVDRASDVRRNPDGTSYSFTDIEKIRTELWHNWCFNHLQIEQSINSMRAQGLLIDYSEGANN